MFTRFIKIWALDEYEPGRPQKSFDKQFVREYLKPLTGTKTLRRNFRMRLLKDRSKYIEAYERITGKKLFT